MTTNISTTVIADGITQTFSYTFEVLADAYVNASVNGVPGTFTVDLGAKTVTFTSPDPVADNAVVLMERVTPTEITLQLFDPQTGAGLTEYNLELMRDQMLHISQEMATTKELESHTSTEGAHMPSGGLQGEILEKVSGITGDVQWSEALEVAQPVAPSGHLITWDFINEKLITVSPGTAGQVLTVSVDLSGNKTLIWSTP
jgi:hypothetical protein